MSDDARTSLCKVRQILKVPQGGSIVRYARKAMIHRPHLISLMEFEHVDTSRVEKLSNQDLVRLCRGSSVSEGWGQLAEVLKRFSEENNGK